MKDAGAISRAEDRHNAFERWLDGIKAAGMAAHASGLGREDCPYPDDHPEPHCKTCWIGGWAESALGFGTPPEQADKAIAVGTCVDAFDEDGDCIVDALPWTTVSDFARAEEGAAVLDFFSFANEVALPMEMTALSERMTTFSVTEDGVYMAHDRDKDVHTFYVKSNWAVSLSHGLR